MLEPVTYCVGDDRVADHLCPVSERQLRGEHGGFVDGALFEQLAQVLSLCGGHFAHAEVIEDDRIGLGHLVAELQVCAAGAGEREVLEPGGEGHVQDRSAAGAGVKAQSLGDEGLADTGLSDQQNGSRVGEPQLQGWAPQLVALLNRSVHSRFGGQIDNKCNKESCQYSGPKLIDF